MHAQNGDIQLSAEVSLAADRLVLSYRVDNAGGADIYLDQQGLQGAAEGRDRQGLRLRLPDARTVELAIEKDIPPVPAGLSPTSLVVPYMTVVRAGASFAETVELAVPVRQYIEYLDNTPPADPQQRARRECHRHGLFGRLFRAAARRHRTLRASDSARKSCCSRIPPGARARHERLAVGPFTIEIPVYGR